MNKLCLLFIAIILLQSCCSTKPQSDSNKYKVKNGDLIEIKSFGNTNKDSSEIFGQVIDFKTKEILPFDYIKVSNGNTTDTGSANLEGEFSIQHLTEGIYKIDVSFVGYELFQLKKYHLLAGQKVYLKIGLIPVPLSGLVVE